MGYTTEFKGSFELSRNLTNDEFTYLKMFNEQRHFKLNEKLLNQTELMKRLKIPVGEGGCFYVDDANHLGIINSNSNSKIYKILVDYNNPPGNCPGLWCGWMPDDSGENIIWDGVEKFYCYTEWLNFIITNFLKPWNIEIYGNCMFQGEDRNDVGFVRIKDGIAVKDKTMNIFF